MLNKPAIPTKGLSRNYNLVVHVAPVSDCVGIPESIMKYICKIECNSKYSDSSNICGYDFINGQLCAIIKLPELSIYFYCENNELASIIKPELIKAGWFIIS